METLKSTISEFLDDDCPRMAAALSYYTVFALPALLILIIMIAGVFVDPAKLQGRILGQMQTMVGPAAAQQVKAILQNASRPGSGGPLTIGLTVAGMLFAATGALSQLQATLNRAWEVKPDPDRGGVKNFLMKRTLSLVLIFGAAVVLLLSLVAQAAISSFGGFVSGHLPSPFSTVFLHALSITFSLVMAILLFGALFEILPDARVQWRDAWRGAVSTGVMFVLGNVLLSLYLARSNPGSAYGAAGSLALILIWIYYSSMIFFLGAELTQVLARRRGVGIPPSKGAVRVVTEERTVHQEEES